MPREKRQEHSWFRENDTPRSDPKPKPKTSKNNRRHLRFEIDEASALLSLKGFLSVVGLRRSAKGLGVMNLSEGGVLLVSDGKVPRGKKVRVRIEMSKYSDFLEVDGVVRWVVSSRRQGRGFYLGVEFTDLDSSRSRKLAQMRAWFTSPEFRAKHAAKIRERMTEFWYRK